MSSWRTGSLIIWWARTLLRRRFGAYAYDLLNFLRFCEESGLRLTEVVPTDVFDYLGWRPRRTAGQVVVPLRGPETTPATKNRRVAALRALFEFLVLSGVRSSNPVPAGRKVRAGERRRGLLGHLGTSRKQTGGRLVVQPRRLPESLDLGDVARFLADLRTARDRAMVLAMLLGGLRSAEVRSLRLADVDLGLRRVRVVGKGGKERIVPVDSDFFCRAQPLPAGGAPVGTGACQVFCVRQRQLVICGG